MGKGEAAGFTLIEVMIAVAVTAILGAVAYPPYRDYLMRSKISEAVTNLSDMRIRMEQFFLDNRTYLGACVNGTVAPLPSSAKYFTYACNLSASTYTVTATGVANQGMGSFQYTVNQNNIRTTASVPAGWTAGACGWTLKKDGSC